MNMSEKRIENVMTGGLRALLLSGLTLLLSSCLNDFWTGEDSGEKAVS